MNSSDFAHALALGIGIRHRPLGRELPIADGLWRGHGAYMVKHERKAQAPSWLVEEPMVHVHGCLRSSAVTRYAKATFGSQMVRA